MDTQNWPKNEWEDIYHGLQEISRKMENIMFNCVDDIDAKRFAQDCYDDIETWMDNCARKGNFKVETLDLTSSKKPIKSADKHYKYDEYLGNIYDSDENNKDFWTREEYSEMVEKARDIFYPAVQKAANACRFTVSDNEAEYVAEKCVRQFFDNTSWDEAVNRPEEYYVNSSKKLIMNSRVPAEFRGVFVPETRTKIVRINNDGSFVVKGLNTREEGKIDSSEIENLAFSCGVDTDNWEFKDSGSNEVIIYPAKVYEEIKNKSENYDRKSPEQYMRENPRWRYEVATDVSGPEYFMYIEDKLTGKRLPGKYNSDEEAYAAYDELIKKAFESSLEPVQSAMPGRERSIRAIMDEYGCSWEEAEEIMNEGIESACHGKSKKSKKKPEKIEQTRRARNTESLNNLYGKMFS